MRYLMIDLKDFNKKIQNKRTGDELIYEFITALALKGYYKHDMTDYELEQAATFVYGSINENQKQLIPMRNFVNDSVELLKRIRSEIIKRENLERNLH